MSWWIRDREALDSVPATAGPGLVWRQPTLWNYAIWRKTGTFFFSPLPYRVISFMRNWAYDVVALVPLLGAGIWWVTSSRGTDLPPDMSAAAGTMEATLLSHHVARFYPTLIAVLLCLVLLRAARTVRLKKTILRGTFVALRDPGGLAVAAAFLAVLAFLDLILVPGGILLRVVPLLVAAAWAWLIRTMVYGRIRLLEATGAGFRPPARILLSRSKRRMVRGCVTPVVQGMTSASARASLDAAISFFTVRGDERTWAWCIARAVEYNLGISALDAAEEIIRAARGREDGLWKQPSLRAAAGLFYLAVGDPQARHSLRCAAQRCRGSHRRVPYRLRMALAQARLQDHEEKPDGESAWTGYARAFLVWNRQYAWVARDVLAKTRVLEVGDPGLAIRLATQVARLVDSLGQESARSDLSPVDAISLALVKAAAWERIGDIRAGLREYRESSLAYARANGLYAGLDYRPRAGLATARAAAAALAAGLAGEDPKAEGRYLLALLLGLEAIEYDRGRLRGLRHRRLLLEAREALYTEVFRVLADCVRFKQDMAAELALWLMESTHRNARAERIRAMELARAAPEARPRDPAGGSDPARLYAPVDIAELRRAVAGRIVLYYRCEHDGGRWRILAVMITPTGLTLHQAVLSEPPAETAATSWPAGLLDALNSGDAGQVELAHRIGLSLRGWRKLSEAILPPGLGDGLRACPVLLVVPDGPLSSVPFAGLTLPDGRAIIDLAPVVFMPNLLILPDTSARVAGGTETPLAVTYLGETKFAPIFEAARTADKYTPLLATRRANDLESLSRGLTTSPRPTIVIISEHGEPAANPADCFIRLSGHEHLSETQAQTMSWPPTVVLGSCWASGITVRAGDDPVGLPTACLLGGASSVIGGQSVVDDDEKTAAILARVVLDTVRGRHPALALRDAVLTHLASHPDDRKRQPAQWANLTVWTSQPPSARPASRTGWKSWTAGANAGRPGKSVYVDFVKVYRDAPCGRPKRTMVKAQYPALPVTAALSRAVRYANSHTKHPAITTLDLLTAFLATGSPDWQSLSYGGGFAEPPWTVPGSREELLGLTDLAVDLDHVVRVTQAVAYAFTRAERLAFHLDDEVIAPAHVAYGFLVGGSGDAARWMCGADSSPEDLIALLGDRVFGMDLPGYASLAEVPRARSAPVARYGPPPSEELLRMYRAASARPHSQHRAATTLDFVSTMASSGSPAWTCLADHGFLLEPPDRDPLSERPDGEDADIGGGCRAALSARLGDAAATGTALAYRLGAVQVRPEHVLYGILADHSSDGARWLGGLARADQGPLTVLAERFFRRPLPLPSELVTPPRSRPALRQRAGARLAAILSFSGRKASPLFSSAGRLAVSGGLLLVIAAAMGLADLNTAGSNDVGLRADEPAVTGLISVPAAGRVTKLPATLIGSLATFYVEPVVEGAADAAREALSPDTPADLDGYYLFVTPPPSGSQLPSGVTLSYRGSAYQARLICGGSATMLCLAEVRLPSAVAPGITWLSDTLTGVQPGQVFPGQGLVYPASQEGAVVDSADLEVMADDPPGFPPSSTITAVRAAAGQSIQAVSPVVLAGRSQQLPLIGVAIPEAGGAWAPVYPAAGLVALAQGAAAALAGARPGAIAYLGVVIGPHAAGLTAPGPALVQQVELGSPADYAGLRAGDQIVAIDNHAVGSASSVPQILGALHPFQAVTIVVIRDGVKTTVTCTLGYRPI